MADSYELTKLDANSFEHLVNMIAMRVLGLGHTGFGPGPDGGRDGFFEGEALYPSELDRWTGRWYIQSKFHKPHLSKDPQKWLIAQIKEEIKEFKKPNTKREWPDNWIVATNIDPSGSPMTGAFDQARKMVGKANPALKGHFHIWGGRKILDYLALYPRVSEHYKHFLTPGHILTTLYNQISDARAEIETILRYLIVKQFDEQQYTKLEQAGSDTDTRPGIHRLFIDLPIHAEEFDLDGMVTEFLVQTAARCHRLDPEQPSTKEWRNWQRYPSRARVWFVRGGPGQGKSTIAQNFCQIQRAALILQDDGPTVDPRLKAIANEIKETAQHEEFWPSVPRIPVYTELREYAQWYGQRDTYEPRGVLTYLAHRIAISVEQEVLAGTLKRALNNRSWFVVFDGLDEVPQDVKDAVALEVRHFVNEVAVETNSDLLVFCTSRPQGYSGQFSELDGPTIDLVSLSPKQALSCAKPVLKLARSEEESKKSYQILESAIESSSVRELMTTPLQAHIMAVVVRDGGRPPDRRWQLYTNFYQVIRRREANRNLPDKRLAKLLREDEQLLKTVHNRLGFILHARAETSEGAQAHLNRKEFQTLVTNAVTQMAETQIENTVEVLMAATMDRLVLVSTPDDGNHVRFDIRPLQEFFAAEFLYEAIDAEKLRQRIELIAGDSHWREVMHFLLSALVENGRRTELAVAIDVLERLNEGSNGDESSSLRLLGRRLGRGSLLAARLLQEGVLEQDKRIRQQFRKCLEPLTAFSEVNPLRLLVNVDQQNSKAWLLNFLMESLQEHHSTENIGAAIVLALTLPDNHEYVQLVKRFILSSPPDYVGHILKSIAPGDFTLRRRLFRGQLPTQGWIIEVVLNLLLRPEWSTLGVNDIKAALKLLNVDTEKTYTVARNNGLNEAHIDLLKGLLKEDELERLHQKEAQYGILSTEYFRHDWTTKTFEFGSWIKVIPEEAAEAPGILQLIYQVLRFGLTRNYQDLLSVVNQIAGHDLELLSAIPDNILAYIPISRHFPIEAQIEKLKSISKEEFDILLSEQRIGSYCLSRPNTPVLHTSRSDIFTLSHWRALLEDMPIIAIYIWHDDRIWQDTLEQGKPEFLDHENVMNLLVEKILEYPEILLEVGVSWGTLLRKIPDRSVELRQAFLVAAEQPVRRSEFILREITPFKLELPSEAPLIPHLLSSLCSEPFIQVISPKDTTDSVRKLVGEFVEDVVELQKIVDDTSVDINIRAAALLMSLLHPESSTVLESAQQLIVAFYDPKNPEINKWYLRTVTVCLQLLATEENQFARMIMGNLLDAARADYEGRQELQSLLAVWRENSYAPIQKAGVQNQWLSEM